SSYAVDLSPSPTRRSSDLGRAGMAVAHRWGVPLVQSMHTLARVKNHSLAEGDAPEPELRVRGEDQLVRQADLLVANTDDEARQLDRKSTRLNSSHVKISYA